MSSSSSPQPQSSAGKRLAELEQQLESVQRLLEREKKANEALGAVGRAFGSATDLDALLERVVKTAAQLVEADRATLYLLEEMTGELVSRHVVGKRVQTIRVAPGQGIAGSVLRVGQSLRVPDAYHDERFNPQWDQLTGYRTRSIAAVPMKNHLGQVVGVLQVLNKRGEREFTVDDEALLNALGSQVGIFVENAKLMSSVRQKNLELDLARSRLERKVAESRLLYDLESAMAWAASSKELVGALLSRTVPASQTRLGAVLLGPGQGGVPYQLFHLEGTQAQALVVEQLPEPWGFIGKALGASEPVRLHLLPSAGQQKNGSELKWKAQSMVAAGLRDAEGNPLGALALYDRLDGQSFSDDDIEMVRLVAANASTALSLLQARTSRQVTERLSTIGSLLSGVLHDLKTPMMVIRGYAEMLAGTEQAEQRKEFSDHILKQCEHITSMQKEVLAFARGERLLLVRKVYLVPFFEELRAQIERELEGRAVGLELRLLDRGTARFDQTKMTRVLLNLVRNAIDAMGSKGGALCIEVSRQDAQLVIEVSDTGPGIPKEIEGALFNSFVTAGKPGGTGLGLAIVKKIVEEHQGSVSVRSSSQGAVFTVRLPQSSDEGG